MLLPRVARRLRCTTFEGALRYASGIRLDWLAGAAVPPGRRVRQLAALARPVARRREPRDRPSRVVGREMHGRRGASRTSDGPGPRARAAAAGQGWPWRRGGREGRPLASVSCAKIETTNVAWKLPLPAYSGSTPIIWGNTIFLNMATAANTGALELWAIDRTTRAVTWKRPIADTNHMERKQNMSSPSPVTDGQHVWVMTGVGVFKAFDFAGKEDLVEEPASRLREVRSQLGLRVLAAPAWRRAVRPGHPRDEDRRSVVRPEDRQADRQDALARRASDRGGQRIAGLLHDARSGSRPTAAPRSSSPAATS